MTDGFTPEVWKLLKGGVFLVTFQEDVLAYSLEKQGAKVHRIDLVPFGGDVVSYTEIGGLMGVEVKSSDDLVSSFVTKKGGPYSKVPRLKQQMFKMLDFYDHTMLMIHGWFGKDPKGYLLTEKGRKRMVKWDALFNTLLPWQWARVSIQLAVDRRHVAQRLISIRDYLERAEPWWIDQKG